MFQLRQASFLPRTSFKIIGSISLSIAQVVGYLPGQSAAKYPSPSFAQAPARQSKLPVTQNEPAPTVIESGRTYHGSLNDERSHTYLIGLTAGEFLHLEVDQQGIDLAIKVIGTEGET